MKMITVHNQLSENLSIGDMIYKYKNIRFYHLVKNEQTNLTYWYAILLLDGERQSYPLTGKLLVEIDVRTLPLYSERQVTGYQLIKEPQKHIPKFLRDAMKKGLITEDMFTPWNEETNDYGIYEI